MNTAETLTRASVLLTEWAHETRNPEPRRLDVVVEPDHLLGAVQALANWGYLAAITGLDLGPAIDKLEILYHFCAGAAVVTLRVALPRKGARVGSVCSIIPYASLFEREVSEMFGIQVGDAPEPQHLFLPDEWPDETYPLRKDWQANKSVS